jgi:hypothetical protein
VRCGAYENSFESAFPFSNWWREITLRRSVSRLEIGALEQLPLSFDHEDKAESIKEGSGGSGFPFAE